MTETVSSDRYVLLERIAVGGMGEVFLARQTGPGGFKRTVVVKRLLPARDAEDALSRFFDEARIAAAVTHENVVTIIEIGEPKPDGNGRKGPPFLAMEYVHGDDAAALNRRAIKRRKKLPVLAVARIVADAARGLQHAHDAKDVKGKHLHIVHRDVSPKNLLVRVDGTAKVTDFGIAMADDKLSKTETGAVAGTLSYMAPEQVASQPLGPAADQFSLGIVFWELLTQRRLFKGDGPQETIDLIARGPIPAPSELRPEVPPSLDAIVLRMLRREENQRFADLTQMMASLEVAVPELATAAAHRCVADTVEELLGDDLRERQKRIEQEPALEPTQRTRMDASAALVDSALGVRDAPPDSDDVVTVDSRTPRTVDADDARQRLDVLQRFLGRSGSAARRESVDPPPRARTLVFVSLGIAIGLLIVITLLVLV